MRIYYLIFNALYEIMDEDNKGDKIVAEQFFHANPNNKIHMIEMLDVHGNIHEYLSIWPPSMGRGSVTHIKIKRLASDEWYSL